MHKNFSLKFKIADIFVVSISLIITIIFIIGGYIINYNSNVSKTIHIYHNNKLIDDYLINLNSLSQSMIITLKKSDYPKLSNDFKIELDKEKGVRIYRDENYRVSCPNHDCEKMGWINIYNFPLACVPNDVVVIIKGSNNNGDATLGGLYYEKKYF